ncbi:MAG: hypothetical protein WHV67_02640, partial [Thermoanaerobaculia bacterium]
MKKILFALVISIILCYGIPYAIENRENTKPIKINEELAKKLIFKGEKLKIDLTEAENYYKRAKKQLLLQESKIVFFRDYD